MAAERYKQTKILKKWKTLHFILSRRRASRDFHQILHGDRGGPCHHFRSQMFLGPIHSFSARGRRKLCWKRPHWSKLLIILSFIEVKQPYLAKLCRTRIKLVNFAKIVQGTRPLGAIILLKFEFFFSFGAVNPTPEPIKVKFGREERTYGPLLRAKFHLDRCNVSPLQGEKPKIGRE